MKISTYYKLRKYEKHLTTAYKSNYIYGITSKETEELIEIGKELGIIYKNNHCPKCKLNFLKKLAKPYFEQKTKLEEKKCLKDNELITEEKEEKECPNQ